MLCDARMQNQDSEVSHSIFTQKHQQAGDPLDRLVEVPAFGHSVNHVGLQLADLAASAFLFPMAARTYCVATTTGPHVDPHFDGRERSQCAADPLVRPPLSSAGSNKRRLVGGPGFEPGASRARNLGGLVHRDRFRGV